MWIVMRWDDPTEKWTEETQIIDTSTLCGQLIMLFKDAQF